MELKGGWAKYREQEGKRIEFTLASLGLPDFKIRLKNISLLTPIEMGELLRSANDLVQAFVGRVTEEYTAAEKAIKAAQVAGEMTETEAATALSNLETDIRFRIPVVLGGADLMILEWWNLTDPFTGEPLPLPTIEDPTPLNKLPSEVQKYIREQIAKVARGDEVVPKAKGSN